MASRKKAKSKARKKARKAPVRKAVRKKAGKKAVRKKAPARRAAPKAKRPAARRRPVAKPAPAGPVMKPPPGERIGVVTHYFNHLSVAIVKLETGTLRVGDRIHFRGHTTDFGQRVDSLQVDHQSVEGVGPSDDFGIQVRDHVREHDVVYKILNS